MKEFSQNIGETVVINGDISVTIIDIRGDEVVLAIDAPEWMDVRKEDVLQVLAPALPR